MPLINQKFGKINYLRLHWPSAVVEVWETAEHIHHKKFESDFWDDDLHAGIVVHPDYYVAMNSYGETTTIKKSALYKGSVESGIYPGFPSNTPHTSTLVNHLQHLRNLVTHDQNMREKKGEGENIIMSIHRAELSWLPRHQYIIFEDAINAVLASPDTIENKTQRIRGFFEQHIFLLGTVRVRFADMDNVNEAMLLPERPDLYDELRRTANSSDNPKDDTSNPSSIG